MVTDSVKFRKKCIIIIMADMDENAVNSTWIFLDVVSFVLRNELKNRPAKQSMVKPKVGSERFANQGDDGHKYWYAEPFMLARKIVEPRENRLKYRYCGPPSLEDR